MYDAYGSLQDAHQFYCPPHCRCAVCSNAASTFVTSEVTRHPADTPVSLVSSRVKVSP